LQAVLAHRARREWEAAAAALANAVHAGAAEAGASAAAGDLCAVLGDYPLAFAAYDRAVHLQPERANHWFNRATVRRFLGHLNDAEADYDRCIALDPNDAQAYLNRSDLRVQTPARNHVDALEGVLAKAGVAQGAPLPSTVPLHYALAKEYDDLGRHDAAWGQWTAGAAQRRRQLAYDPAPDLQTVGWLMAAFPGGAQPAKPGNGSTEPIFIVSMPRTGSTLVDRMISGHSRVTAAGELPHFGNAIVAAARRRLGREGTRPELVAASAHLDFAALGADYLARTRPATGGTPHFTDKLPLNYLYCGLIAAALPDAKIVHVSRAPMATCFGIYKVLFDQGYPFSYDLRELADYYIGYRRLMAHWQATLPERIIEISYETLVGAPEAECRRLIGALGLPWEQACVDFHRNPSPTTTASASQVRRPIYTSGLEQWRHYAAGLEPLRARLEQAGINTG
jgi:hypothetical protein